MKSCRKCDLSGVYGSDFGCPLLRLVGFNADLMGTYKCFCSVSSSNVFVLYGFMDEESREKAEL